MIMGNDDRLDQDRLFFRYLLAYKLAGQSLIEELTTLSHSVSGTRLSADALLEFKQAAALHVLRFAAGK